MDIISEVMKWVASTHNHSVCVVIDKNSKEMTDSSELILSAKMHTLWASHDPWMKQSSNMFEVFNTSSRESIANPYGLYVDNMTSSVSNDALPQIFCVSYIEARHERFRKQRMTCIRERENNPTGYPHTANLTDGVFSIPVEVIENYLLPYPQSCRADVLFVEPVGYLSDVDYECGSLRPCKYGYNRKVDMSRATSGMHIYCTCFGRGVVRSNDYDAVRDVWVTKVAFSSVGDVDIVCYDNGIPVTLNNIPIKGHFIPTFYFNN